MCGRFQLDLLDLEIDALLLEAEESAGLMPSAVIPRKEEICPADLAPVLVWRDGVRARVMRWGFPHWQGKNVIFNARLESAEQKQMFAGPLRRTRAVIPCSGFFEWRDIPGAKRKQKILFHAREKNPLWLAGIYADFPSDPPGLPRFVVLTTEADNMMAAYHTRMPVILARERVESWLRERRLSIAPNALVASDV